MNSSVELDRLAGFPVSEPPESGRFLASVLAEGGDPEQIRSRSADVLRVVLEYGESDWPSPREIAEGLTFEVSDWPTTVGALAWLLRAAGASRVTAYQADAGRSGISAAG
jgi:hypothetical protein